MSEENAMPAEDEPGEEVHGKAVAAEAIASVFRTLFKWGGLALIAWQARGAIEALAGETTAADFGITVRTFANVRLSNILAWAFGVSGVGYGLSQRGLRRRTIEQFQGRIKALEGRADPDRTSSGLTERGETRPEDR